MPTYSATLTANLHFFYGSLWKVLIDFIYIIYRDKIVERWNLFDGIRICWDDVSANAVSVQNVVSTLNDDAELPT